MSSQIIYALAASVAAMIVAAIVILLCFTDRHDD
jgi:hypothetical protein